MATVWDDPAVFGPWGEPAFVGVFGAIGLGKSTDQLLSVPDGWTIGLPGSIKGARWILGDEWYSYARALFVEAHTVPEVTAVLRQIANGERPRMPVKLDDATLLGAETLGRMQRNTSRADTRYMYARFKLDIQEMKRAARIAGVTVLANFHEQAPGTDGNGQIRPGGPAVGAPSATPILVSELDVCYRLERDETAFPWPVGYRCDYPHAAWAYKDRHGALRGCGPANLRELLRSVGYLLPRPPALAWMDEVADRVASLDDVATDPRAVMQRTTEYLIGQGVYRGHAYWAVRDGIDRARVRRLCDPLARILAAPSASSSPFGAASAVPATPADSGASVGSAPPPIGATSITNERT